jgi:two-component system, NtrC family, sensor kinase
MDVNRRILVIDDNEAIHVDFTKVLGGDAAPANALDEAAAALFQEDSAGPARRTYDIDSAYQGLDGLQLVRKALDEGNPYALAFVDVRMPPGLDGIETTRRLWEIDRDLQIVICTAYSDYSWNDMVSKLGETDRFLVIKKPFDNIEVRQVACALTTKWALAREAGRSLADLTRMVDERTAALAESNARLSTEADERRRAHEVLRNAEERVRAIVETAAEGIISIDEFGVIELFNPAAEAIFGYTAAEIAGRNIALLMPPEYAGRHDEILAKYRATGVSKMIGTRTEAHALRKNGTSFPVEISVSEARVGRNRWFTGLVRDLSQQKHLEAQLLQAQKLEAIGQLAAGIAHEINTPIQYVGDNIEFIEDSLRQTVRLFDVCESLLSESADGGPPDDRLTRLAAEIRRTDVGFLRTEIPEALRQSREGIKQVADIVGAMKEFSHPGTEKTLTDVNRAIESTAAISRNEWKYVADLETDLDPDVRLIPCLPGEINQVFLNLIVNAAHAIADTEASRAGKKGTIRVSTRFDEEGAEIRISDTGTGIPEGVLARIFEPFFTTKEVGRGTGQGLAIAHAVICKKHGGSIRVETKCGVGTTFCIRLPACQEGAGDRYDDVAGSHAV